MKIKRVSENKYIALDEHENRIGSCAVARKELPRVFADEPVQYVIKVTCDDECRDLLYGAVTYSKGLLGTEPVRSQGHIHAVSPSCGASTCEVYEIWSGAAYIYMQESAKDNPGRCFAVYAKPGDVVIVPPDWAHATIVGDVSQNLTFGAWCVRDYGFDYDDVRAHGGIAWFPQVEGGETKWLANHAYKPSKLVVREPRDYAEFGLRRGVPIYQQFIDNPDLFLFVSKPDSAQELWEHFEP